MGIELRGLTKAYGAFSVSLDLSVADGETLVIAGPSGCGKTTALRLMAGLAAADSGALLVDGEDRTLLPPWKRDIAVVFQDHALFPHLSVSGNVGYAPFIRGVTRRDRRRLVEESLRSVRLEGYGRRRIQHLSGGERQRVAIARALAASPRLLLLDEPFSSLDGPLRRELRAEFAALRAASDIPCVFVTHDREEAAALGDRIVLMDRGRVAEVGTPRELFLRPKTAFAARFFGSGEVLPCRTLGREDSGTLVDSPLGRLRIEGQPPSADAALFVPYDALWLQDEAAARPPAEGPNRSRLEVLVEDQSFEGERCRLRLRLADGTGLSLSVDPRRAVPPPGHSAGLRVDAGRCSFLAI